MSAAKSALTTSWEVRKLGAICQVIAGQSPSSSAYNDVGKGLPFYQGKKQFTDRYLAQPTTWTTEVTKKAEPADILMSVRAPVGPINEATETVCIGRGLAGIRAGKAIDRGFLWYALLWLQPKITGNPGAVFPSISKKAIEQLPIPLASLEEQKRLVALLNQAFAALDRTRANADANLADAHELLENSLNDVFRDLATTSAVVRLEDAVHPNCKLSYGIVQPGGEVEAGLPIVRPVDLKQRVITLAGLKSIDPFRADGYTRTKLVGDELLLCVRGSTGELSIASPELAGGNVTRGIVPIRFEDDKVIREFAYFQLRSRYILDQIAAKTYGAALMQINIKDLRQLSFVVPPISLQRKAVELAEHLYGRSHKLRSAYEQKLTDIADLRQSLLQKAFSGELI